MENRKALLPLCSGVLGVISLTLQVIALATPYWAHFSSDDPLGTGTFPAREGNPFEEGHYGLWRVCLEVYEGRRLTNEVCDLREPRFDPGALRYYAGMLAIVNAVLLLIFLFPIPVQIIYLLKEKGIVSVQYTTLTFIKIMALVFGAVCGVAAAVLVGIHTKPFYKIPKGWSFGFQGQMGHSYCDTRGEILGPLQDELLRKHLPRMFSLIMNIVVVILQVFLFICATTEHMVGRKFPKVPLNKIRRRSLNNSNNNDINDGLPNMGFSALSPDSTGKGGIPKYKHPTISVTPLSGNPYSMTNNSAVKTAVPQQQARNGKTVRMLDDDLNEPRNRNSMQYLEEMEDVTEPIPEPLPARKPVVKDPSKSRRHHYKNSGYHKSSRDSDLDASNPSLSSRNGNQSRRNNSPSVSSDVSSFTKSTDV